mmetsp:Transcript_75816/g.132498  ORF Transcript_75816/g.132498 Transcript_75816/m.132498 type:complete len:210 (-) Transcript_75816:10-639(-)
MMFASSLLLKLENSSCTLLKVSSRASRQALCPENCSRMFSSRVDTLFCNSAPSCCTLVLLSSLQSLSLPCKASLSAVTESIRACKDALSCCISRRVLTRSSSSLLFKFSIFSWMLDVLSSTARRRFRDSATPVCSSSFLELAIFSCACATLSSKADRRVCCSATLLSDSRLLELSIFSCKSMVLFSKRRVRCSTISPCASWFLKLAKLS